MTDCEYVIDDKGTSDFSQWKECKREGTFTVTLEGSDSASNIAFFCWQHVKRFRRKRFVEQQFGKGAKVEILRIGK